LIAPQLIQTGNVTHTGRAALGVQITSVDAALATQHNLAVTAGVLIVGVASHGPAQAAGLKPGDVIVQVGTRPVTDVAAFADALLQLRPGEVVPVSIYRGKEQLSIKVTLGEAQAA
jgi:S1-C subfamily serine protease